MKSKTISAQEFDEKFHNGEDISDYLDMSSVRKLNQDQKRVNVDFPQWMVNALDKEATRVGVTRQSIIKIWIAEKLNEDVA